MLKICTETKTYIVVLARSKSSRDSRMQLLWESDEQIQMLLHSWFRQRKKELEHNCTTSKNTKSSAMQLHWHNTTRFTLRLTAEDISLIKKWTTQASVTVGLRLRSNIKLLLQQCKALMHHQWISSFLLLHQLPPCVELVTKQAHLVIEAQVMTLTWGCWQRYSPYPNAQGSLELLMLDPDAEALILSSATQVPRRKLPLPLCACPHWPDLRTSLICLLSFCHTVLVHLCNTGCMHSWQNRQSARAALL